MDLHPPGTPLPRWLHLLYTNSWTLFISALPVSVFIACAAVTDSVSEKIYIGLFLFAVLIGMATVMHAVAERITKRRYGFGIGGFTYRK